jgi:hypothetical protein
MVQGSASFNSKLESMKYFNGQLSRIGESCRGGGGEIAQEDPKGQHCLPSDPNGGTATKKQ